MKILAMVILGFSILFGAVDINTADKEELMSLKGLGDKKAAAVIEYRAKDCFESVEGITKVKGIGKKFIEKNRDNLIASECKTK
ncbi:putative competence protein ComEA, helix-hairpin-helix region domain [Sulfurimonas gotlandica GD1]|uniref:Putative competence protein ComEA, helix-hairpin-helix region domain n=1 Tax=Sulfurimonas gotlandica (strain DSM 19862 / JCM 16533 / GD1) TaxID=929558 RepID=B6BKD6_SULGG|nr:helix-hairpin-helix domain-containing protein [Sulfurimonas gotlandica]EDZ62300.1 competence protein ComEA helix-hairpin-helix repeat region [Sulfurimonas gotlandica GD1]EHP28991.1 putative competence protein ComEA, helix-hairpin-helix region domain [Sulfurimonas gotlandica GD1]